MTLPGDPVQIPSELLAAAEGFGISPDKLAECAAIRERGALALPQTLLEKDAP